MLTAQGCSVRSTHQIQQCLDFVQETCLWFPEEGTVNSETREKARVRLHDRFSVEGPNNFPIPTFALWGLIRDTLDPTPSASRLPVTSPPGEMAPMLRSTAEG